MKRVTCLIFSLFLLLCSCNSNSQLDRTHTNAPSNNEFIINNSGNIVSASGVEYAYLANEMELCYLGELEFVNSIQGEKKASQHLGSSYQTGMFAIKDADNDNLLIRNVPDNEWSGIYRKTSLPSFDFSVDNCVRLEFVSAIRNTENDAIHATCGEGIIDTSEIAKFLSWYR